MRALLAAIIVCVFGCPLMGQPSADWEKLLEGAWEIDYPKTSKLWESTPLKKYSRELPMIPIASPDLNFSDGKVSFQLGPRPIKYRFVSYDESKKRIVLVMIQRDCESQVQLKVNDENSIVLDMPTSILGPIQIVYSRVAPRKPEKTAGPLKSIVGTWKINEPLTRKMWTERVPAQALEAYQEHASSGLSKWDSIEISESDLSYADGTFEPWELLNGADGKFLLRSTVQSQLGFEVYPLDNGLIQLTDSRRRFVAIYSKGDLPVEYSGKFPRGQTAQSILNGFQPNQRRSSRKDIVAPIGRDGNVVIDEFSVERRQVTGAVVGADLTTGTLGLMLESEVKHPSVWGGFLVRIKSLNDIRDNRGHLLLTPKRREGIRYLSYLERPRSTKSGANGKRGPVIHLVLEAPSLGATEISEIKGELEMKYYEPRLIRFENVSAQLGKPLSNSMLADLDIRPDVERGAYPGFSLKASKEAQQRILRWYLVDSNGRMLQSTSEGHAEGKVTKGYPTLPAELNLVLEIAEIQEHRDLPFRFEKIQLK